MEKSINLDHLTLGVCYYPEHWPRDLWRDDLKRMKEHGIEVVRIAEFAWNKFEPEEGVFTFDFFDSFMDLCLEMGMKVIFCTPTATPPAWLTHKYPEALNANVEGVLYRHGLRRHYTYNSPKYRELSARIAEELGTHYGAHPMIVGWQIDNEFNCETNVFYSESDHKAFRAWMKARYETLDNLNDKMGTTFWNQTYTDWEEVYLTRPVMRGAANPHMTLEEKRFFSESAISFCKMQADILKKHIRPGQFITTNGLFGNLDSHKMTNEALDFITFDSYPNFAFGIDANPRAEGSINDRSVGRRLAITRSISPNFGIMEQQAGGGGWNSRMKQPMPKPGQMRLWAWQSIAHGADFVSFFRWRTCWIGTEIYWHGLNDYANTPNRRLQELKNLNQETAKLAGLAGSTYKAEIALVRDYANEWDSQIDMWRSFDDVSEWGWFEAAQRKHAPMDYLYLPDGAEAPPEQLARYKLLVYPHACILTEARAKALENYVRAGGILVFGCRAGYKDAWGRCPMQPMPGPVAALCGLTVSDYTCLGPADDMEQADWDGTLMEAPDFNEILDPAPGTEVLARFKGNYYDGAPALTCRALGKGRVYYYGAAFSEDTANVFLEKLGCAETYADIVSLTPGVEIAVREKAGHKWVILLNYLNESQKVDVRTEVRDAISGGTVSGAVEMPPYGVMILELP